MEMQFCWRCKIEVPFLNQAEWLEIAPLISKQVGILKEYRAQHGCTLQIAIENAFKPATEKYLELTGFVETNYLAILHHRLSLFGSKCEYCGHFLRTPKAKFCAGCGESKAVT